VAATHVDLEEAKERGDFREDLYFRLAVVILRLPPLRQRGDDLTLLAQNFLQRYSTENGKEGLSFSPEALRIINRYEWPGNVRELQNRIHRAVIMAEKRRIDVADLELDEVAESLPSMTLKEAREETELAMIKQSMHRNGGKVTAMAVELGVSRPTLYELMNKLKISRD
jgi:two-component system NtrC family response regulator